MKKNTLNNIARGLCLALCLIAAHTAFAQSRISGAIRTDERVAVKGTSPDLLIARSNDAGRLAGNEKLGQMVLLLAPTAQQDKAAASLVSAQHDPSSPSFHKWLTPAQFGQQFGVAQSDSAQVRQWLEGQGLTVRSVSQSGRFLIFSGNVAQVENAFSIQMHSYTYKDKSFISNSSDIEIPAALKNVVKGVVRLHSDPASPAIVLSKNKVHFNKTKGQFTSDDGSHYMAPADFAKIYNVQPLYDAGINGTGQTIAIVGESNISVQDVTDFRNALGLPPNDPQVIVNGDDPGQTADIAEATLDVTWAGAVAPMAHIDFVVSQSNFAQGTDISAEYIVDNNLAPVMSESYGACESSLGPVENAFYNALWQQAAAQGITAFVSAGDAGGADCDAPAAGYYSSGVLAVNGLASTPYNVAVGGTQFDDTANPSAYWSDTNDPVTGGSALGYIPEVVWNESNNDPQYVSLYAGGGGVSSVYAKPDWQIGTGVPNDNMRDLPDISLTAAGHDGYLLCIFGYCSDGQNYFFVYGGTSASSPAAAGVMALVNQKMGGAPQGMANYVFYRLANVPGVYHDTTQGNNKVPDPDAQYTVGYDAAPGYDLATGLGSMDVNALVNNWQAASTGAATATTLALGTGQKATVVHGTPINFQATVACATAGTCTAPSGTVALSATSATAATVGAGAGQLTPLAQSSVANIPTATVPGGSYTVSARYGGDGKYSPSSSNSVPVTVTPEKSQTFVGALAGGYITSGSITIGYGLSWPIAIAVAGNSGYGFPTGSMTLTADGAPITTGGVYDFASGTYTPSTLTLNYGENVPTFLSLPGSQSSTLSTVIPSTVLGAGVHHLVASYPGDASFSTSQGSYTYTVSQAQGIIEDFFVAGSQVINAPIKLVAQMGFDNNGFAPYAGVMTVTDLTSGTPVVIGTGTVDSSLYGGYWSSIVNVKTPGTHTLRLDYAGDANVKGTSQTFYVPFPGTADSYVNFGTDVTSSFGGQPVTLTAMVGSDIQLHVATGTVTFFSGTTAVGTAPLDATGTATLVSTTIPGGTNNLSANYSGDSVLNPSVSSPVTTTVSDYLMQPVPNTLSVYAGATGNVLLNLIPQGGFAQQVQLACSGLPTNVSCRFVNSTATLDGVNPAIVSLFVNTRSVTADNKEKTSPWAVPSAVALAGLFLLPLGRRKRIWTSLAVLCMVALALGNIGCGGSSANPPAKGGTYHFTVTATSVTGTTPKTTSITLNIQ